jgi:hypothetical protein
MAPDAGTLTLHGVQELVRASRVLDIMSVEAEPTVVYTRGKPSSVCTVVMAGELEVLSGDDGMWAPAQGAGCLSSHTRRAQQARPEHWVVPPRYC